MKATVLWEIDGSKITKKRKQLGQLPSHGGKAIKISGYSFGVFTFVTKMQKPEPSGRSSTSTQTEPFRNYENYGKHRQ